MPQSLHKLLIQIIFFISLYFFSLGIALAQKADLILLNYRAHLYELPLIKQEHFAVRMYRMTGDEKYLTPIMSYIYFLSHDYRSLLIHLSHPDTLVQKVNDLLQAEPNSNEKYKIRAQKITQYGDLYFYLYLLETVNKIYSYHLENTTLFPQMEVVIEELKKQAPRLSEFILDKDIIKLYGAQLINYVYYLDDLNIIYLKKEYTKIFQTLFDDALDDELSSMDYEAKIYGMTHFITAASHYYQYPVDEKEFAWISHYFERHIKDILKRTENDVIAEVGVCLLLLNKPHSIALKQIKTHLNLVYNEQYKIIPNAAHSTDLVYGEHRNILTIMLFKWPEKLFEGPFFNEQFI